VTDNLAQRTIFIVDDEPDSINVVKLVCEFHGATVYSTTSSPDCIPRLGEIRPDILFLDIQMPVMTGWEIIKQLREDDRFVNLTVIAMTAHAMSGDKQRALDAGFTGYLSKPISPISFLEDLEPFLVKAGE